MSYIQGSMEKIERFTSTGTWTRPAGVTKVDVLIVGGGGGGEDAGADACGGGGGQVRKESVQVSGNVTVTIGSGGAAGDGGAGGNGADSTFAGDTTLTAIGGGGGAQTNALRSIGGGYTKTTQTTSHYHFPDYHTYGILIGTGSTGGAFGGCTKRAEFLGSCSGFGHAGVIDDTYDSGGGGGSYGDGGAGHATTGVAAAANSGGGGGGANGDGGAGGSGYAIVTWLE